MSLRCVVRSSFLLHLLPRAIRGFANSATSAAVQYQSLRLHSRLFDPPWPESWFDPRFQQLIEVVTNSSSSVDSLTVSTLPSTTKIAAAKAAVVTDLISQGLITAEADGIYSFPMFTRNFTDIFLEELDNFYATGIPARRPNSMNMYGVIVNDIGMRPAIDELQRSMIQPLADLLFPEIASAGGGFDGHHSFIVRYNASEDKGLDMHTDDSDVTLNACLGRKGFEAAGLRFCGVSVVSCQ
jgi:hypothetical protein